MIEATDTPDQERTQDISLRETEGRKIEAEGREREWGSWGGGSKPPPHQLGSLGRCELSQQGSERIPDRLRSFPLSSALGMAS